MKEALGFSKTSVLTRATWRNIPEDTIPLQMFSSAVLSIIKERQWLRFEEGLLFVVQLCAVLIKFCINNKKNLLKSVLYNLFS
jgi:hypothetical protein